jgi:hypothetical protein
MYRPSDAPTKVGQVVRKRFRLPVPVDLEEFARIHCELQFDVIPADVSGLYLPRRGKKPLIIVDESQGKERQTFTLAHELGHHFIPWHGTPMLCGIKEEEIGEYDEILEGLQAERETEASRFAVELVSPREWRTELIRNANPIEAIREIQKTGLSLTASYFAMAGAYEPGNGFALRVKSSNGPPLLSHSPNTQTSQRPSLGGGRVVSCVLPNHKIISDEEIILDYWTVRGSGKVFKPSKEWTKEEARDLGIKIMRESGVTDMEEIRREIGRITGKIGAMNGRYKGINLSELEALALQDIRTDYAEDDFSKHKDLSKFINARIYLLRNG